MTAPGIAIVNPNPKIAGINLNFDFIDTSPLLGTQTMPERMQAECQCGIRTESHTIALLSARYWRRNGEESPRLPALRWPGSTSVVVFGQGRRSGRTPPPSAVCQDWRLAGLEQLFIGSDQSQPKHPSRR